MLRRFSGLFRSYFNARFEALVAEVRELRQELSGNAADPRPAATSFADTVGTRLAEVVREPFDRQHDDLMAALALVARSVDQTADVVNELQERLGDTSGAGGTTPSPQTRTGAAGVGTVPVQAAVDSPAEAVDLHRHWPLEALDQALADVANYAASHNGWAAQANLWFNPSVSVEHRPGGVVARDVNERIAEVPHVFQALAGLPRGARVLDLGGRESTVPLSLASLGHEVVVVAPDGYPLAHANLTTVAVADELLGLDPFDAAVLLSVGGTAGPDEDRTVADGAEAAVLDTVWSALRPGGTLVLTSRQGGHVAGEAGSGSSGERLAALLGTRWTVLQLSYVAKVGPTQWQLLDDAPSSDGEHVVLLTATKADV